LVSDSVSKRGLQLVKIGADARWRSPTFRNVYSPKTPQSSSNKQPMGAKPLELLALPRGLEPLFSP
jgi:hypothetical protein